MIQRRRGKNYILNVLQISRQDMSEISLKLGYLLPKLLTLYLMGGGIECLPLANIAPVHQGVTFLITFFDDNSYLYIYYQILCLPRPKVSFKKFYRYNFEPGVIFKNQKLSKIFVSEAKESCKGSKWGFFWVPSTTRPFQGGLHVYFMCLHVSP